jgi:hypothetical protein
MSMCVLSRQTINQWNLILLRRDNMKDYFEEFMEDNYLRFDTRITICGSETSLEELLLYDDCGAIYYNIVHHLMRGNLELKVVPKYKKMTFREAFVTLSDGGTVYVKDYDYAEEGECYTKVQKTGTHRTRTSSFWCEVKCAGTPIPLYALTEEEFYK